MVELTVKNKILIFRMGKKKRDTSLVAKMLPLLRRQEPKFWPLSSYFYEKILRHYVNKSD